MVEFNPNNLLQGIEANPFINIGVQNAELNPNSIEYIIREQMSDVNMLSGLLNALDGVAASEGRILFASVI